MREMGIMARLDEVVSAPPVIKHLLNGSLGHRKPIIGQVKQMHWECTICGLPRIIIDGISLRTAHKFLQVSLQFDQASCFHKFHDLQTWMREERVSLRLRRIITKKKFHELGRRTKNLTMTFVVLKRKIPSFTRSG